MNTKICFSALVLCTVAAAAAPPRYAITELTPSDVTGSSWGYAIHNDGRIAGARTRRATQTVGTVWTDDRVLDYNPLSGGQHAWATALGSNQAVFGYSRAPFFFTNPLGGWASAPGTAPTVLRYLPQYTDSPAMGVNNSNQVAGWLHTSDFFAQEPVRRAYTVLVDGALRDPTLIPTLGGWSNWAYSINNQNVVVGGSFTAAGPLRAFRWSGSTPQNLGTLGGTASEALDINNVGSIVGWANNSLGARRAFVWRSGIMFDLGTLGGATAEATAVNDTNVIVGQSWTATGGVHAFAFHGTRMYDLQNLSPAAAQGWILVRASDINASGVIVGWGSKLINGRRYTRGFRLDPLCPADFNSSRSVDFFDYLDFVQAFADESPIADFNHNGTVDFFDYLDFVAEFDSSCA